MKKWTTKDSEELYCIKNWSDGYFNISENGEVQVLPNKKSKGISLEKIVEEAKLQGVRLPAVIRFHDILRSRIKSLVSNFEASIKEANYDGKYFGVFPIKVNQMREVVEEIVDIGQNLNFGLEAGSKAELLAVLAHNDNHDSLSILNGYKDTDFLKLAILGTKLGRKFVVVIEKYSELINLIEQSKIYNCCPIIGLRGKLTIQGHGRWKHSSGERAKFGLSSAELINAINLIKENNLSKNLQLFHFHLGSQVTDIKTMKDAINEGGRIYTKLYQKCNSLKYFDVGGGLAIDYDGTKSKSDSSKNYGISEYCSNIIYNLKQICDEEGVPHPNIVSESGRAITAHHSLVVTNVIETIDSTNVLFDTAKENDEHIILDNMRCVLEDINSKNIQEMYNESIQLKNDAYNAFKLGILSLTERAKLDTIYWRILTKINECLKDLPQIPEGLQNITKRIAPQYLLNFSVFQSAADTWAIKQILPIMPLKRLDEKPDVPCSIVDITCDSDGKIDNFISRDGHQENMYLHKIEKNEDYNVALFLTGAYQDVMGDMHNLFGRLNEVHVYIDEHDPEGFYIEEIIKGNSCSSVLSTMQYNPEYMAQKIKKLISTRVNTGNIKAREGVSLVDFYENCLFDYTYLK